MRPTYLFASPDGIVNHRRPGVCIHPTKPFTHEEKAWLRMACAAVDTLYGWTDSMKYKGVLQLSPPVRVQLKHLNQNVVLFGILNA